MLLLKRLPITILVAATLLSGCSTFKSISKRGERFDTFFNRFFTDTVFQKSRVKFPIPVYTFSPEGDHFVEMPNIEWRRIYTIPKDTIIEGVRYKREIKKSGKDIIQRVYIPQSGFQHNCTFRQINGLWFLIRMEEFNY